MIRKNSENPAMMAMMWSPPHASERVPPTAVVYRMKQSTSAGASTRRSESRLRYRLIRPRIRVRPPRLCSGGIPDRGAGHSMLARSGGDADGVSTLRNSKCRLRSPSQDGSSVESAVVYGIPHIRLCAGRPIWTWEDCCPCGHPKGCRSCSANCDCRPAFLPWHHQWNRLFLPWCLLCRFLCLWPL